ncbi:4-hydroxy-tetrahydrodipicolinate synthase [bacterium Unc6]|nr:4-hydroxy-tetrahydrodipicolinate synthase [bacterium Unc6]
MIKKRKTERFTGSMVAIVTPFYQGKVDRKTLEKLVEFQVQNNTSGIVPCGTTGESPTLDMEEHKMVNEIVIQKVRGRIPVIAGTGSNNTREAIELTHHAKQSGADAVLLVAPYYNRPTQAGLYEHFKVISKAVNIPGIIYNIPSRTGVNIEPDTMAKIADLKNVIGIKEASGNLDQMSRIIAACPEDFILLSGDDCLTLPVLSIGGKGVISVAANIVPKDISEMIDAFSKQDIEKARRLHYRLLPLLKVLFIETNPVPVKTAMVLMGLIKEGIRLPLTRMSEQNFAKLKETLHKYGLI